MGMAAITFTNFLFFSFFFLSPSVYTTDIRYCGKEADYEVKIYRVDISPNPVTRGRPATFSLSAFTEKAILGGKLNIDVSYFGWHVYSDTHDLCTKISCPVPAGDFVISHSQLLPVFTPPVSSLCNFFFICQCPQLIVGIAQVLWSLFHDFYGLFG